MENTKVKEIFIKEYPCFDLYQIICKNGATYMKTKTKLEREETKNESMSKM